jgi:hypothetical protein
MSNKTKSVSPNLYGDIVVATGQRPLHVTGSLEFPKIRGDINFIRADITYPYTDVLQRSKRTFCYETVLLDKNGTIVGKQKRNCPEEVYNSINTNDEVPEVQIILDSTTIEQYLATADSNTTSMLDSLTALQETSMEETVSDTTTAQNDSAFYNSIQSAKTAQVLYQDSAYKNARIPNPSGRSLLDVIDVDTEIRFVGPFQVNMSFGVLETLKARIGQINPNQPLRYVQNIEEGKKLYGNLRVEEGSTYSFYRTFNATGTLSFPTGDIKNPSLELQAILNSQRVGNNSTLELYTVT